MDPSVLLELPPALVWGTFVRALGVALMISLGGMWWSLAALSGTRGLTPQRPLLRIAWRNFRWRALFYHPSIFWVNVLLPEVVADFVLTAACAVGVGLGGLLVLGGAPAVGLSTPVCMGAAWALLVSIDAGASALMFPWDSLLLEITFLAAWLPPLHPLLTATSLAALRGTAAAADPFAALLGWLSATAATYDAGIVALPTPLHAALFRYLAVRVLVGFGKMKFLGSTWKDRLYIKTFLINQPILTPAGWLANRLMPDAFFIVSLAIMWAVEIPLPLLAFIPGWPRIAAALGIIALMGGIQLTGNYGYFNVLTIVACIPLLHAQGTILDTRWDAHIVDSPSHAVFAALVAVYMAPLSLLCALFNSWINLAWAHWPVLRRMQPQALFNGFVRLHRALAPLRIVQAYGVFPPNASPPQRWVVQYEASWDDGATWHAFALPYLNYALGWVAPYHPRVDHSLFYESMGMNGSNMMGALVHHSPYVFSSTSPWVVLQYRLAKWLADGGAEGDTPHALLGRFAYIPQPPPASGLSPAARAPLVRASLLHMTLLPFDTAVKRAWSAFTTGQVPPLPGARPQDAPAYPTTLSRLDRARTALWQWTNMGDHLPPMRAYQLPAPTTGPTTPLQPSSHFLALRDQFLAASPESFWWESAHWRNATVAATTAGITPQQYEAAWLFLHRLRRWAGLAAGMRADASAAARDPLASAAAAVASASHLASSQYVPVVDHLAATNVRIRTSARDLAAAADACTRLFAATDDAPAAAAGGDDDENDGADPATPGRAASGLRSRRGGGAAVTRTRSRSAPRRPTAAAAAAPALPCADPLPLSVANAILCWEHLPLVVANVFATYTPEQLLDIRRTIDRMTLSILRICERVWWRPPPSPAELAAEAVAAGFHLTPAEAEAQAAAAARAKSTLAAVATVVAVGAGMGADRTAVCDGSSTVDAGGGSVAALYARLGEMIEGTAPPSVPASVSSTLPRDVAVGAAGERFPVSYFGENTDAGIGGCMRSHVRFGMAAHWLMLVGGRQAYERVVADADTGEGVATGRPLPVSFKGPGVNDWIARAAPAALFARLATAVRLPTAEPRSEPAAVSPHNVTAIASEAGTFLLATVHWDMFASVAQRAVFMATQGRPKPAADAAIAPFLPGFLEFVPKLSTYHGCGLVPWDHSRGAFARDLRIPRWAVHAHTGAWRMAVAETGAPDGSGGTPAANSVPSHLLVAFHGGRWDEQ